MGKTRDLFKKTEDIKETFHEKMGRIKQRNNKDLTLAEEIKKRQQGEIRKPSSVIIAKKIEENNRMGKTRDLFKKIRDTKGTFHAKMGSIKDRNGMTEQKQKILRRGGKNTQNYTKQIFTTQIIMMV